MNVQELLNMLPAALKRLAGLEVKHDALVKTAAANTQMLFNAINELKAQLNQLRAGQAAGSSTPVVPNWTSPGAQAMGLGMYSGIDFNPNQSEMIQINGPGAQRISTERARPATGPGPQAVDEEARMAQVRAAFIGADDDDDDFAEDS